MKMRPTVAAPYAQDTREMNLSASLLSINSAACKKRIEKERMIDFGIYFIHPKFSIVQSSYL